MNQSRRVYGIGESVLDILFKNEQPMTANPGGSVFNSMISVGRSGTPATFITQLGDDHVGDLVKRFLNQNGVDTNYIYCHPHSQTRVALAFLDEQNDASYEFYHDQTPVRITSDFPEIVSDDVLLLGSFFAVNPAIRPQVRPLLRRAQERKAILYYDINYRKPHAADLPQTLPNIRENMVMSDVVRGSSEDCALVFGEGDARSIYEEHIRPYCPLFIYTDGPRNIQVHTPELQLTFPVSPIETISTVGAGDSFNAGFVYGLLKQNIQKEQLVELQEEQWSKLIASGQLFSSKVCQSTENYIPKDYIK